MCIDTRSKHTEITGGLTYPEELAGIAQSVEHRALGRKVLGSYLASASYSGSDIGQFTPAVASPYQGVKLGQV